MTDEQKLVAVSVGLRLDLCQARRLVREYHDLADSLLRQHQAKGDEMPGATARLSILANQCRHWPREEQPDWPPSRPLSPPAAQAPPAPPPHRVDDAGSAALPPPPPPPEP